jgi:myo-inositol 2-dehydrogenase/D-chiro-inositol 1-dehydrogenase
MTLRMGILGVGRIGRLHAEHLSFRVPGAEVSAICDVKQEAAREVADQLRVPRVFADPAALVRSDEVDAVVICTSTDTHADLIEIAAASGKHIFCEKPLALDLKRIDRAVAAADAANVKLQVGFNRRFDPSFAHVQAQVAQGVVGAPHLVRITSRDPHPPSPEYVKVSGGIFMDMTIHDFDMARFLVGSEPKRILATGSVRIDPAIGAAGDVDTAVVIIAHEDGTLTTIDNSRKAIYGYDQRIEVFGAGGMVWAENKTPHNTGRADAAGMHAPSPQHFFMDRYTESFIAEMSAFVQSILRDSESPVSGLDGRVPVVMAMAAKRSMDEARWVSMAEIA